MAKKLVWGRAWHGRSYDLGKMTLPELWAAYLTYPAINLYAAIALAAGLYAGFTVRHWTQIALPIIAVLIVYPLVWYGLHRFVLHGRWLYRMRWSAALWKRIHFDHHQDPHKLEVLFGDPLNTIPTMAIITLPIGFVLGGWTGAAPVTPKITKAQGSGFLVLSLGVAVTECSVVYFTISGASCRLGSGC